MRSADFLRRKQCCRNFETQALKVAGDDSKPVGQMSTDVFEDAEGRLAFREDPSDLGPQVPVVGSAHLGAGHAEGLAGVSAHDEIHAATPWSSVEGADVRPDRSRIQGTRRHSRDQIRGSVGFPLHHSDRTGVWASKPSKGVVESKLEAGSSGEK